MIRARTGRQSRALVLAMLLAVYTFNFVDRQILAILAAPIQAELRLDDARMGLLGGLSFALLYSTLAVPLGWLADRSSRTWVVTLSLGAWSAFTALCGAAGSFGQLFACRLGVGIGEAGGVAPSYALIADTFPARLRARALAIYSLGSPLGSGAGVLLGGYIAATVDWRWAFLIVGLAGLLFAPIFRLAVREPERARAAEAAPGFGTVARLLAATPAFWLLTLGASAGSAAGYGIGFWLPSLLRRSFGLDLLGAARFYGALLLIGGSAGVLAGGWLGDRLGGRDRGAYARVAAIAYLAAIPLYAAAFLTGGRWSAFLLLLLPQALSLVWLGPVLAAVQHLVPAAVRATASACFLLVNNLIGLGLGAWSIGLLSTHWTPTLGGDALRYAMLFALVYYLLAGAFMLLAARPLRRQWLADDRAGSAT